MDRDLSFLVMVDGEIELQELLETIQLAMPRARPWKRRTLKIDDYWIELRTNEDFDPRGSSDPTQGYLYFRYRLEATPISKKTALKTRHQLAKSLCQGLREAGLKVELCSQLVSEASRLHGPPQFS